MKMEMLHQLQEDAIQYGIKLSGRALDQFCEYQRMLLQWNEKMNLTAITTDEDIRIKHFLDSLLLLCVDIPHGARVIDVGTGAGFPGVPLKIVRQDLRLTLLDSLNKRILFLRELSDRLGQNNDCIHGRAEDLSRKKEHREQYDFATARAVAALQCLSEYCIPFVRINGVIAAMKGYEVEEEIHSSKSAIKLLGGMYDSIKKFNLPGDNRRSIVVIRKISQTPTKYPRNHIQIAKYPL